MTTDAASWIVEADADRSAAYATLSRDRIANGYALADLEPPFDAYTVVALAHRGNAPPSAACQVLRHPDFTTMVTYGDAEGLDAILAAIELPASTHASLQMTHLDVFERRYTLRSRIERVRMAVTAEAFRPPGGVPAVERLGPADAPALLDLYADYEESFFNPMQLDDGVFYGAREGGVLLAAGGTHVVAPRAGLAGVGNVYTRPEARGRGYATAITATVVAELLALPCRDVFLNVWVDNHTAIGVYERLGFRTHSHYWEVQAERCAR